MKLKLLKLTNCLGIEEKEIQIGKVTLIEGESESGKTSIIDSIRKGLKNENVRPKFVKGEEEGIVFMQFDEDLEVTRKVKADNKSTLKISKDGMTPQAPQTFLNDLLGDNNFAPVDWLKKKDEEQTADLLKLLPIKITEEDIEDLTGEKVNVDYNKHGLMVCEDVEKHFMETRKEVNANVKAYDVSINDAQEQLPTVYNPKKYRNVKLNELFENISNAENNNNLIEKANMRIENSENIITNFENEYKERLKDLENEFNRRKKELKDDKTLKIETENKKVIAAKEYISKNKTIDTDSLKEEVKEIEEGQSYLRVYDKLVESQKKYDEQKKEAERLTEVINKVRNLPSELLAKTKSPIKGMTVEKGNVNINGLPLKNLSDGKKLRLAIDIAKATSKDLKLILLNGFEQLNWELQTKMFKDMQNDEYQYIITRVADGELSVSHIENNTIINIETGEMVAI